VSQSGFQAAPTRENGATQLGGSMPIYKVTLFFNQFVMGGSETYWTPNLEPPAAVASINTLLQLRNNLLWDYHEWVGVRIALEAAGAPPVPVRRNSRFFPPGSRTFQGQTGDQIVVPVEGVFTGKEVTERADQWRAVMQMQIFFADTRSTIRYMSGIPDVLSSTEAGTLDFNSAPNWMNRWGTYRDFLVNNSWQLKCRQLAPTVPDIPIAGLVLQEAAPKATGLVLVNSATLPGYVVGERVHIKGQRAKPPEKRTMNGIWYVSEVNRTMFPDLTVLFLRSSGDIPIASIKSLGTVQQVRFMYTPFQAIHTLRAGIHKRGRPSPAPLGRRLTRMSFDP
jgi:hypothetical protein